MVGSLRRTFGGLSALLLVDWACVSSAITFEQKFANVYDVAPKVRIAGAEFSTVDAASLKLNFVPKLELNTDYKMEIQSDSVIVLSLQPGKTWIQMKSGSGPKALYLASVKVGETTVQEDSIQIATILPTPTVDSNVHEIYMKTTPKLIVNGTNFNVKSTELYYDPPLQEGTKIQKQVLSSTQISLVKVFRDTDPVTWTEEPGPLKIRAINTGAGPLAVNPEDGGVVIAEVQADLEAHGITVEDHDAINIYQSTKELKISGNGFLSDTKVRFANALRGGGTNFTITNIELMELTLTLEEGSSWRKNPKALPGALVLLAANAGAGWVPLGPTTVKAGRKVATVFEDPSVVESKGEIYRTHTHELYVQGTGFNRVFKPQMAFEPAFDFSPVFVEVVNRTTTRLSLSGITSEWSAEDKTGPLMITGMDTGAGMKMFDSPVTVANVVADADAHESGVQVHPSYGQENTKYQSSKDEPLVIYGTGFKGEPVLNFDPPIWSPSNYTIKVMSEGQMELNLVEGSVWKKLPGALVLKGINVGDGDVELAEGKGVKVATILEDPKVMEADRKIYASHTKSFLVKGSGFVSIQDPGTAPTILLDGISSSIYMIQENWHNGMFNLQLMGEAWATVAEGETKIIRLMSINTGAGFIEFPGGVKIAEVRPDDSSTLCEDSCTYANDGTCDEAGAGLGSSSWGYYNSDYSDMMYQQYGWGYDDDANSFMATNDYSNMYRYAGYDFTYHSYSMTDDAFYNGLAACDPGTDCTDCGVKFVNDGACENTCPHARDGSCDDPRSGGVCPAGTDCQDCGEWGDAGSNFTDTSVYVSNSWFDDDDWEMMANDDALLYGQEMNAQPLYKRNWNDHHAIHKEADGAGTIFVDVLWAMVVLVGCSVSVGGIMVAYRHFKSGGGGAPMYLPVQAMDEVELSRRGNSAGIETTPDVVRIG